MFSQLMRARRFAPLFWCQFLSAFNDNFVRQMLAMLILFRFAAEDAGAKISLAVAVFVLPSIPLSAIGGEIADAHDKALVARRLKLAEIFIQMIAAAGFYLSSLPLLYAALFGLGCISALFGPIKYGILPDHLKKEELIAGNALVEGATFAAILCGLALGGYAAAEGRAPWTIVFQLMVVALACYATSRYIPATGIGAPHLKVNLNPWTATRKILSELRADDRQWVAAIAVSWFWMVGAIVLSLIPVIVKSRNGGGIEVETAINLFFAVGIAAGSLTAAALSDGRIELAPAPFLLILMGVLAIAMGLGSDALPHGGAEVGLAEFFTSATGLRLAFEIIVFSFAAGMFVVPIFTAVQSWSSEDHRARVVGAVNTLNSLYMVAGSLAMTLLLKLSGLGESAALALVGLLNLLAAVYFFRRLPANFYGFALQAPSRLLFRLEVFGLDNIPAPGIPSVIAVNHVSYLDAPILRSLLDGSPIFVIDSGIRFSLWMRWFSRIADVRRLDPANPQATRALIKAIRKGRRAVLFIDGRIEATGSLTKTYASAALIAEKAGALVTPVRLEGPERTRFSRLGAKLIGRSWFPKIVVTILPPRTLAVDPALPARARRHAAGLALYDIMSDLLFATADYNLTLFEAFERGVAARNFSRRRSAVQDPNTGELALSRFRLGVALLANKISAITLPGENVGLMLPNANGAAVTFMALQAAGRVAAMLNFTAGPFNLIAACQAIDVRTVLCSRAFVEKGKLELLINQLEPHVTFVWLEDLRDGASTFDKIKAIFTRGRALARRSPADPAAVLFTSGSEGAPKGVALSHANILANIAQISARFEFTSADVIFNPLPIFHAFGLTGGLLLGLMSGIKVYLYPTPLHYRQIPELVGAIKATAIFGTDTFLSGYARNATPDEFRTLRYVVCGAEPVKAETRRIYLEKFGLRIFEGYGVTETSPVLAVNTPIFNRPGSVGRLMPDVEHRLERFPGFDEGGRLQVRGPNVMAGYYRVDNPGELEQPRNGWHDTGDIVSVDPDGFVWIKGRAKRFAKIAGEQVSLASVEQLIAELWPDETIAVVAAPDPRKGERLVLITTKTGATRAEVQAWLKIKGASEIMAPASVVTLDALPVLGSGKVDYVKLGEIVRHRGASAAV